MKFLIKSFLFTVCLLNAITPLNAATLKGNVIDANLKDALIGASVVAKDGVGTTTDIDGNYTLELDAGSYSITFSYIGYHNVQKNVVISDDETKVVNIGLQEAIETTDEIVVTGSVFEKRASEKEKMITILKQQLNMNYENFFLIIKS